MRNSLSRRAGIFRSLSLVIVIFDSKAGSFPGRLEALELGPGKELFPDGLSETLDFAEGHSLNGLADRGPFRADGDGSKIAYRLIGGTQICLAFVSSSGVSDASSALSASPAGE